ncbi:AMP-binding protein, partial [Myxococcaceae bacterium JPH2]|nr:AMP-binding protein [Myxococcaceae bacterium JPH2]
MRLDAEAERIARSRGDAPPLEVWAESLAYVTYTSGSTGKPKGVAIPHRGVVRLLFGSTFVQLGPQEVILQSTALTFDPSTLEIWGALLHGGRLVLAPPHAPDVAQLARLITTRKVSTIFTSAALFDLMQQHEPEALARVRQLVAGGDVMPVPSARARLAQGRSVLNAYGPTESTAITTCHLLSPGDTVD